MGNNCTVDARETASPGRLLIIGGGEDRCCGSGVLERFVELCGGSLARITLVTTATGTPDEVHAEYEHVFRKLGVPCTRELRLRGRGDADGDGAAAPLRDSTGVFISGGDQPGSARWSARAPTTSCGSGSPAGSSSPEPARGRPPWAAP